MKVINVTEFKAHLSKYLRMASRGSRIIVQDRDEPVAQLGPVEQKAMAWRSRLTQQGRLRQGTQVWDKLKLSPHKRFVDIQASLRAVRGLPGNLDDSQTAVKRKELGDLLAMLDLAPIDRAVIDRAKSSFAVNVRALDAIHVATALILGAEAEGEPLAGC